MLECSHFIPPENTKQPLVFVCFQGLQNGNIGQSSVKEVKSSLHMFSEKPLLKAAMSS